jgi:chaperone required for assembly of F1-ATPase
MSLIRHCLRYKSTATSPTISRFWKTVSIRKQDTNYEILLDNRVLKTPDHTKILVPREMLALLTAAEWVLTIN